jgi:Tfp pilus assembly protein PilO
MDIDIKKIYKIEFWLVAIILCAFFVLDIYPQAIRIFSLLQTIDVSRKTALALPPQEKERIRQELLNDKKRLDESDGAMRGIVSSIEQKISGEKSIPNITLKLEELSTGCGIDLLSIKPSALISEGGYDAFTIDLEFESEYGQLINFLSLWAQTPFYLTVEQVTVSKSKETSLKLDVNLKLKVLFKQEPKTL